MGSDLYKDWWWNGSRWVPAAQPSFERARLMLYDEGRLVVSAEFGPDALLGYHGRTGRVRLYRPEGRYDSRPLALGRLKAWELLADEPPRLQLEAPRITLRYWNEELACPDR
jgi:hypothetical protein